MADIELTRSHSLGLADGRDAVERVAQQLENDIGVDYEWDENTLLFDGQAADGEIAVEADRIAIEINLSAFLRPMQGQLEQEAERYLDEYLQS
jgi:putative polyhydroxyalkanoate system protein